MVDQQPHPPAGSPSSGVDNAGARELASAIRDLASAIRETAAFTELEFVPCTESALDPDHAGGERADDGDAEPEHAASADNSADGAAGHASTVLPLVPTPRRGNVPVDPERGALCRPGGCGCDRDDTGEGRHARRDPDTSTDTAAGRPAGSGVAGVR